MSRPNCSGLSKLALTIAFGAFLSAFGFAQSIFWIVIAPDGPFTLTVPSSLSLGTNESKPFSFTITDWDLAENSSETQASILNTQAGVSLSIGPSGNGVYLADYYPNGDVLALSGYTLHKEVVTIDAVTGDYLVTVTAHDSADSPATDSGSFVQYMSVSVN